MNKPSLLTAALLALGASHAPLHAGTRYWDPNGNGTGGGTGLWLNGGSSAVWCTDPGGGTPLTWANANNDNAYFRGRAGTVTINTSSYPLANSVVVQADGYTFTGNATWGLTLSTGTINVSSGCTLHVNGSGSGAFTVSGTSPNRVLIKDGDGTIHFETSSGSFYPSVFDKLRISGGTCILNGYGYGLSTAPTSIMADNITISNAAALSFDVTSLSLNLNRGITIGAGGGAINVISNSTAWQSLSQGGPGYSCLTQSGLLTKTGTGTLGLYGANTGSGGMTVLAGILYLANASAANTGPVMISGGTIELTNSICIGSSAAGAGDVTLDNGTLINDDPTPAADFLSPNRAITINSGGGTLRVANINGILVTHDAGAISGSGTLTKDGPGEFRTHSAHNSFRRLIINAGIFCAGSASYSGYNDSFGAVPSTTTADAITIRNGAALRLAGGADITLDSNQGITMAAGGGTIRAAGTRTLAIPGVITGSGNLAINVSGTDTGVVTLSGANTCSGSITLSAGALNINNAAALGTGTFIISGGTINNSSAGAITLANNNAQTWSGDFAFTGSQNLNLGTGAVTTSAARTVTVNSGNLTVGGNISGSSFKLTKAGAGTLALAGANTFTGGATAHEGTLLVNNTTGSGTGTGDVTVDASGTLGGTGAISGNVTWSTGAQALLIAGSPLRVSGHLTLNNNSVTVTVPGSTPLGAGTYTLLTDNTSGSSGSFNANPAFTGAGKASGTTAAITTSGGNVILTIQSVSIPTSGNLSSSPNPSLPGSNVTFTVTVTNATAGGAIPAGNVQLKTNSVPLCGAVTLDANGVAVLITNSLPHGSNTLTAEYAGDGIHLGLSNSVVQVVNTPPTCPDIRAGLAVNQTLVLSVAKLLRRAGDADPGDTLRITAAGPSSTNGPATNVVLDTVAGSITYMPPTGYVGSDSFMYTVSDNYGGAATPAVFVTIISTNNPSPNIVVPPSCDITSGTFRVTFAGIPGYAYTVQTAPDPGGPWTYLKTSTADMDGLFEVTDCQLPPPPARYYRTLWP
jgi:autotransporter-associated beta strand protein